jgi:hypothetical protein
MYVKAKRSVVCLISIGAQDNLPLLHYENNTFFYCSINLLWLIFGICFLLIRYIASLTFSIAIIVDLYCYGGNNNKFYYAIKSESKSNIPR